MKEFFTTYSKIFTIVILFYCSSSDSQIKDNLSYSNFGILEDSAYAQSNFKKLENLIKAHTNKAKAEKNNLEVARSFYYKTIIGTDSLKLRYADSIIHFTQNSKHMAYPTTGYIMKGGIYFDLGKFDRSLTEFLTAYDFALIKNNHRQIQTISFNIAAIRNNNGQTKEAIQMYHKSLSKLAQINNYKIYEYDDYNLLINNITLSHLRLKNLDSAKYYAKIGLKVSKEMSDKKSEIDFKMINAQIHFFEGQYQKTIDSVEKYIENYSGIDRAIKLYYLGKSNQKLHNAKKSIEYFLSIDSIVTETNDSFDEIREVYQDLIIYANSQNEDVKQLEYIEKLLYFDSLMTSQKRNVFNAASVGYDLPLLRIQKADITEKLNKKSRWNMLLIYSVLVALIALVYFIIRGQRIKSKIKKLLESTSIKNNDNKDETLNINSVPDEKTSQILIGLHNFEKNLEFLDNAIDLPTLSENLETNTSYLSMVINKHKKKSFPNYLKRLRIDYALKRLSSDKDLLKYNYQGLAEIFGFKSSESFSRAFYSQNGVYPSHMIKELKKKSRGDNL